VTNACSTLKKCLKERKKKKEKVTRTKNNDIIPTGCSCMKERGKSFFVDKMKMLP
jgi:hypothetical protein